MHPECEVIFNGPFVDGDYNEAVNRAVDLGLLDPRVLEAGEDGIKSYDQLVHYLKCRDNGCSRKLAQALAMRSFAGIKTDAIFNEGRYSSDKGKVGAEQIWLRKQAEDAGVSTNGKWYCRGLSSFPGDPTAWVDGRGDVLRVAREKNMTVEGYVEHKGHKVDPVDNVKVADDIIEREVKSVLSACPEAKPEDVREKVYAIRSGSVDANPLLVD